MITIREDVVGAQGLDVEFHGWHVTRRFVVKGLTGLATALPFAAVSAVDGGSGFQIPQLGTGHPYEPSAVVTKIHVATDHSLNYIVDCLYSFATIPGPGWLESIEGSLVAHESGVDALGSLLQVTYTPSGGTASNHAFSTTLATICTDFSFEFQTTTNPRETAAAVSGRINSATFLGFGPHTVLCRPPRSRTRDNITWNICWAFSVNPLGWDGLELWRDKTTGAIPTGVGPPGAPPYVAPASGNGWVAVQKFPAVDFNTYFGIS